MKTVTAKESNQVNKLTSKVLNSFGQMNREDVLKSFPQETVKRVWDAFCHFIEQNYESGKGTHVKGFGTFTFADTEVNLEGTTNQFARDHKARKPIFIVSKEFLETLRPGQYNPTNGIIYYNQKQSNSLSHVKINYAELAYCINISKDEYYMILTTIFLYLADTIRKSEFKNKEMPGIGTLMLRGNILAIKFDQRLVDQSKSIPQKLLHTKKNVLMFMEAPEDKPVMIKDLPNVDKALKLLRPKTAVITKINQGAEKWLKDNLDIDLNDIREDDVAIDNQSEEQAHLNFINDKKRAISKVNLTLKDLNIEKPILEAFEYHKGVIIAEMKNCDRNNTGMILKQDCVNCIMKANIHNGLTQEMVNNLVKIFSKGIDNVDYMNLMTCLLKDIKRTTNLCTSTPNNNGRPKTMRPMSAYSLGGSQRKSNISQQNNTMKTIQREMKAIKMIQPALLLKYETTLHQKISIDELLNILRTYSIVYPKSKIEQILDFIEINNHQFFSLSEFNDCLNNCKVMLAEMSNEEIIQSFNKLKDIIYVSGGKSFLFNNRSALSLTDWLELFADTTKFSIEVLTEIFNYLTKKGKSFTENDYQRFFEEEKRQMDEEFKINAIREINKMIRQTQLTQDEYFSHLLSYNISRESNIITKVDFHKAFLLEKMPFTAEEIDYVFNLIDIKRDNVIDRQEFLKAVTRVHKPLFEIQDIIKKNRLDIEDLAYRMQIDSNKNQTLSFYEFKAKMKLLDYSYSNEFIQGLFDELAKGQETITTNALLSEFNVFQKEHFRNTNNSAFKENFMENMRIVTDMATLKKSFEKIDSHNNGRLTKADFCSIIQKVSKEFKDEDIMKFTRITQLVDSNNLVKYPEFLNMIFFNAKDDIFYQCIEVLKEYLISDCNKQLEVFFQKLNHMENRSIYEVQKWITIEAMFSFLKQRVPDINTNVVCKFDLDTDGKISYEDIEGVFERYLSTSFFKFENSFNSPNTNLYASDIMTDEKFKSIVKEIKAQMKKKNITDVGLFKKLDINGDGFVTNYEFNKKIDSVILLSPAIKDQFFNYLDYYKNGMVDLNTFLKRFKEFKSNEILVKNNNTLENEIINAFSAWIKETKHICDTEIFNLMDNDSDGLISFDDFKHFTMTTLKFSIHELNDYKLQRVIQALSLTKNKNIGLADIREFLNKCLSNNIDSYFVDLKEKFKETINQNLSKGKENTDWINEIIEKFGLFISERYDNVEEFFSKNAEKNSNKFKLEDFIRFHELNYECFSGFNLTRDEVLAVFTSLDSQKKNFLTLDDFQTKMKVFDFYKKMHLDIRHFLQQNFSSSIDCFKFFKKSNNIDSEVFDYDNIIITKKEFFDSINHCFPNKYPTETILKYMKKKFKDINSISYSEFSYIFFDKVEHNENFVNKRLETAKLSTTRPQPNGNSSTINGNNRRSNSARAQSAKNPKQTNLPFEPLHHPPLETPFDSDALTKMKRIINSTHYDYSTFFKAHENQSNNGMINQFEFKNMVKKLNIGLTNIEIDQIIAKIGMSREGKINLSQFIRYITSKDSIIEQGNQNIKVFLSQVKALIYKYYSNPKMAFQFNDKNITKQLDFNRFKTIVLDLYERESKKEPNFSLLKNSFDYIDLRKDGIIDINEWAKAFAENESGLDVKGSSKQMKVLREWEGSSDVQKIYAELLRNRKLLRENIKPFVFGSSNKAQMIQCDNFISVLKDFLPRAKLSNTQWKMLVKIADREKNNMIDFDLFMSLAEGTSKELTHHPRFK